MLKKALIPLACLALLACSGEDDSVPIAPPVAEPAPVAAAASPAPAVAVPQVVGTVAYITLGREAVTLNEPLTISGAAAGGSAGIDRVELLVDGQLFAVANYGERRPIGGPIADADPNKPNLGFSVVLDPATLAKGKRTISFLAYPNGSEPVAFGEREVLVP